MDALLVIGSDHLGCYGCVKFIKIYGTFSYHSNLCFHLIQKILLAPSGLFSQILLPIKLLLYTHLMTLQCFKDASCTAEQQHKGRSGPSTTRSSRDTGICHSSRLTHSRRDTSRCPRLGRGTGIAVNTKLRYSLVEGNI